MHLVKVLKQCERLERVGATAVFVVHDEPELIRRTMLQGLDVPYPVVVDTDRHAYRAWGLRRGSLLGTWLYPAAWVTYARLLLGRHERFRGRGRDTLQLGGDFIVDRGGTIAYSRPQSRDDRPPVGVLMRVLEQSPRAN